MERNILELEQISKIYDKEKIVLDNLSLRVNEGQIVFLIGPNGVGKTTLVKIILGLLPLDNGQILFKNQIIQQPYNITIKKEIGYLPDEPMFIEYLTSIENLQYYNAIYKKGWSKNEMLDLLNNYGLSNSLETAVKDFSRGMRQKLSLSFLDIVNPNLIIMDEPTIGLDLIAIEYLKNHLLKLKNSGKSLIITSHDILFCQDIADEIYILNQGQVKRLDNGILQSKERGIIERSIMENIKN